MRIVIAHEPRAYREVLEQTLAAMRPHLQVTVVEPESLDSAVAHLSPHLVFSSRLAASTPAGTLAWITLYPGGERLVVLDIAGRQTVIADLELQRLISIVDETERLLAQNG